MEVRDIEALFAQLLTDDYESEIGWKAVHALRLSGSRKVFERAAEWCFSDDPVRRARAAAILCQLQKTPEKPAPGGVPRLDTEWLFRDESYDLITRMLETERDALVLNSVIHALGHLNDARAVPTIISCGDHPDGNVRFAVAFALGCFPNDPRSVDRLLKLTSDTDAEVRDWAVFGLGVLGEADSPEIRDTLLRCLDDADENVCEEAAVGLGKRQDQRLVPRLRTMLNGPGLKSRVAEAAAALLGLDKDPAEWSAEDYKAALAGKFDQPETT
jgi:HEAT repeat protein